MSDYYMSPLNKTFFLSGSFIYHTDNSGSNADKTKGTLNSINALLNSYGYPTNLFNIPNAS